MSSQQPITSPREDQSPVAPASAEGVVLDGAAARHGDPAWARFSERRFAGRWAACAFLLPLLLFAVYAFWASSNLFYLEIKLTAEHPTTIRVVYDAGDGFAASSAVDVAIPASEGLEAVGVPLTVGRLKALRFYPLSGPTGLGVGSVIVRTKTKLAGMKRVKEQFSFAAWQSNPEEIDTASIGVPLWRLAAPNDGPAPERAITITPHAPLAVGQSWYYLGSRLGAFAVVWALLWLPYFATTRMANLPLPWLPRAWRWCPPVWAVWLAAALGVVLSCYPVIFFGKSFCSPNFIQGTYQLYGMFPTLPGTTDTRLENGNGADLGSMAWAHGPYAVVQSRSLFRDHELPLWNRYNNSGLVLLGQGQSMFGDPLHWLVIAAGGQAWSWDVKFILARLLFAAGVGLLVLATTDYLPAALLLAFSSCFIGFFTYRLNHPDYFSLCYEPWILFTWMKAVRAPAWRSSMRWACGLILANWAELTSGTAKEAYMNVVFLNAAGALLLLGSRQWTGREKWRRFVGLAGAGAIFTLLWSPMLLTFVDALGKYISLYDQPHAWQIQPGMLIGLFDDIFYRQLVVNESVFGPSLNFLVLVGVLFALSNLKRLSENRTFAMVALGALPSAALAFGVVPPSLIRAIPRLGNIIHIDDTFSCVLFIHLFVLAGFGLRACLEEKDDRAWRQDALAALLLGAGLLASYFGFIQASQHTVVAALHLDQEVERSRFFCLYVPAITAAALVLPFVLRRLRRGEVRLLPVVLLLVCLFTTHFRFGVQMPNGLGVDIPVLPNRVDLSATSDSVAWLHEDHDPFRTVGFGGNLMPGYSGVIDLEGLLGPDALAYSLYYDLEHAGLEEIGAWFNGPIDQERIARVEPLFDLLNVRYMVVLPFTTLANVPGLTLAHHGDLDVYRNESAWPRAFFVDRLGVYDGVDDFVRRVHAGDGRPFAAVDRADLPSLPPAAQGLSADQSGRTVAVATRYRLTNHRTFFDLDVPGPGVIVLTEAYMKDDIQAELNGRRVPVWRVNQAFRGIVVDQPGTCHVVFDYAPPGFTLTLWAAGIGLALFLAAGWWLRPGRDAADGRA